MLRLRTSSQTIANALLAAVFCQDAKIKNMPYRCYPLKGLSKPNSCTLLETARDEHFNASYGKRIKANVSPVFKDTRVIGYKVEKFGTAKVYWLR